MIGALNREEHLRRAFGFAAALILLIQVLFVGAEAIPVVAQSPVPTASSHHAYSGHHSPGEPAHPAKAPHCSWCILCGKLGVAVGAPPAPIAVLLPEATCLEQAAPGAHACVAGRSYAVLPLGARAPPPLV